MKDNPTIVSFPITGRRQRNAAISDDEKLAREIRRAWRKLERAIKLARAAGLNVETHFDAAQLPVIERRL